MEEDSNPDRANIAENAQPDGSEEKPAADDYREKYLYLLAEFDNYKKSLDKQFIEAGKLIKEKIIFDMIKVLDDFESVMKTNNDKDIESLMKALYSVLSSYGLTKMNTVGQDYSPDIAEVVATEGLKDKTGKIIEEIQTGYKLNDRIIRYPKVKIGV